MSDKKQYIKLTTPRGVASFPKLNTPEVKVGLKEVKPRYTCSINLDKSDAKVATFLKQLDGLVDDAVKAYRAKFPKKKVNAITAYAPARVKDGEDYTDSETHVTVRAKTSAFDKKGNPRKVPLLNAKGEGLKTRPNIGGGSIIRMGVTATPYDMAGDKGSVNVGVTLYLDVVKIIELVEFGGASAKSYGLDEDEGDYEGDESSESIDSDESAEDTPDEPAEEAKGNAQDF